MKRIVVTGANKGIGLAIVRAILEEHRDAFVYLGSRDLERGRAALRSLPEDASARVEVVEIDVGSDRSVAAAAAVVKKSAGGDKLWGLVNNAGVGGSAGLAETLQVNALGVVRVTEALLPLLEPDGGRVVNITSASGPIFVAQVSPERRRFFVDREVERPRLRAFIEECLATEGAASALAAMGLGSGEPYGLSKACANLATLAFAREQPRLRINACTPGFIETDLTRPHADAQGKTPAELGMKEPAAGTRAPMFLLFGDPQGSGGYYGSDAVRSPLDRYRAPGSPAFVE